MLNDPDRDPRNLRRTQPYNEVLPATMRWMHRLPAEIQPVALMKRFPRLANVIARSWHDVGECQRVLDDLLTDRRGGRQGFPLEITEELLVLRDYFQGRYAHLPTPGDEPPG
jgi:hypothetical protein